jgi:hypothetical protein
MKAMSAYGYEIVQTLIVDIERDEHVKKAMNEINAGMYAFHISTYGYPLKCTTLPQLRNIFS